MPQMSGLDAIIAIRGEFPETRITTLTTYAGDVQALRALRPGGAAILDLRVRDGRRLSAFRTYTSRTPACGLLRALERLSAAQRRALMTTGSSSG
jgi:DNA-binding NarL/FixJ family response regulator